MNLNERIVLCCMTVCGTGTAICGTFPTLLSAGIEQQAMMNVPANSYSPWCEGFGYFGIIFMSASSCLSAMLSITRYVIVTYPFRSDVRPTNCWLLVGQVTLWVYVICFYVVVVILVNAGIGLPLRHNDVSNITNVTNNSFVTQRIINNDKDSKFYNSNLQLFMTQQSTNVTNNTQIYYDVTFITANSGNALLCAPNWREIPSYFIAVMICFYIIPLILLFIFYLLVTRTAYKQVRDIQSTLIRPSVTSEPTSSNDNLVLSDEKQPQDVAEVVTISQMLFEYTNPLRAWQRMQKTRVSRRKATRTFLTVVLLFFLTWTPYFVYYIIECNNYHVTETPSSFNESASYFITGLAMGGRIFSIVVYAILNRPLRLSVRRTLRDAKRSVTQCYVARNFMRFRHKVVPATNNNEKRVTPQTITPIMRTPTTRNAWS
ncbi:uncharacterized protein LOC100186969 [Ciona intestinalis]